MRPIAAAILFLIVLGIGFGLGYYTATKTNLPILPLSQVNTTHTSTGETMLSEFNISSAVEQKPILVTIHLPDGTERAIWVATVKIIISGDDLSHPVEINDVKVYVKVMVANQTVWREASREFDSVISYDYSGDKIIVPGERAGIEVSLNTERDYKPLEMIVEIELEDVGTLYTEPINLS